MNRERVFVTRKIPGNGLTMLREAGFEVDVSSKDRPLSKQELISAMTKRVSQNSFVHRAMFVFSSGAVTIYLC